MEPTLAEALQRSFRRQGIKIETGSRVESVKAVEGRAQVVFTQNDERRELTADRAIVALSVRPNTEHIGLEAVGCAARPRLDHG